METSTKSGCDDVSKNPGGDDSSAEIRKIPPTTQPAEVVVTDDTVVDPSEKRDTTKPIKVLPNINDVVVVYLQSKCGEPVLHDKYSGSILLHDLLGLNSRLSTKMGVQTLKHISKRILAKILQSEPNGRLRIREPIHTVQRSFLVEEKGNDGRQTFRRLNSDSEEAQSAVFKLFLQCYNLERGDIASPATKKMKIDAGNLSNDISEEEKFADAEGDEKVVFVTKSDILLGQNANGNTRKPGQPLFSAAGNKIMAQMIAEWVFFNLPAKGFKTNTSKQRVDAVISMVDKIREDDDGTKGRFLVAKRSTDISQWYEIDRTEAAEVVLMEFFQAWKDSKNHVEPAIPYPGATRTFCSLLNKAPLPVVPKTPPLNFNKNPPSKEPVDAPTDYDVLFGRGGLTNHHPGNSRYRDLIGMHRPDYVAAIKAEKPDVSKRIVVAIREGNPPGRFLKKNTDGLWYDVGDRHAAEKTSQALREKSREERYEKMVTKRRSESLKRKQEKADPSLDTGSNMVRSYLPQTHVNNDTPLSLSNPRTPNLATNLPQLTQDQPTTIHTRVENTPPSAVVKCAKNPALPVAPEQPVGFTVLQSVARPHGPPKVRMDFVAPLKSSSETEQDKLGPIDADGNVIVTDNDILCGRGGRTNHHIGNRRFRDIVSLHRPDYVQATKVLKPAVARLLVNAIRTGNPPGRFLKKDDKTGKWHDIGDKRAAEKASQALRERTEDEQDSETPSYRPTANAGKASQPQRERTGDERDRKSPSHPPAVKVEENSPEGEISHLTPTETKAGALYGSGPTPPASEPPNETSPQTKPDR